MSPASSDQPERERPGACQSTAVLCSAWPPPHWGQPHQKLSFKKLQARLVGCGSGWWAVGVEIPRSWWGVGVAGGVWEWLVGCGSKSRLFSFSRFTIENANHLG
jgi:hypothetical protein